MNDSYEKNAPRRVFLVGDSTVSAFSDGYIYPRYGWGTQISNYLADGVQVHNLALSGRSSKSFISEPEYSTLREELGRGDILLISFGHNDEKSADATRFTDARLPHTDGRAFGYYLNEYYIRLARERGAIPVLCTPIVRANEQNDYTAASGHITPTGDYAGAIRGLGDELGVAVIDLCKITKELYIFLGCESALKFHAVVAGKYGEGGNVVPDMTTVDTTHLNIYGAKTVAYTVARELKKICPSVVVDGITPPSEADLLPLATYKVPTYEPPRLDSYVPTPQFETHGEWYGTAFGATGDDPTVRATGFVAREESDGTFTVGQSAGTSKGKIARGTDGIAFLFRPIRADEDFILSAKCEILTSGEPEQSAFGLMLRDDCVVDQHADGTANANYVTAGALSSGGRTLCNFSREGGELFTDAEQTLPPLEARGVYSLFLERVGQRVSVRISVGERWLERSFFDFDLFARDTEAMYAGVFATRGMTVRVSELSLVKTGKSQGA